VRFSVESKLRGYYSLIFINVDRSVSPEFTDIPHLEIVLLKIIFSLVNGGVSIDHFKLNLEFTVRSWVEFIARLVVGLIQCH